MYISNGGEWKLMSTLLLFYIIFKKKDSLLLNMFNNQGAQIIGILRYMRNESKFHTCCILHSYILRSETINFPTLESVFEKQK
jgi:hypothetical protein